MDLDVGVIGQIGLNGVLKGRLLTQKWRLGYLKDKGHQDDVWWERIDAHGSTGGERWRGGILTLNGENVGGVGVQRSRRTGDGT